jgi:DNA-directed RNA polymerase specialized sigma24 family protein
MRDVALANSGRFCKAMADHRSGLLRFLRGMRLPSHRIEDVAQTTFLILLEALPRISAGSERAFLYSTAVRLV